MKKSLYALLLGGLTLSLGACSSDEPLSNNNLPGDRSHVEFTVSLPDLIDTRAYGDVVDCNQLTFTVFDESGEKIILEDSTINAFGPGVKTAKVSLDLVVNQSYKIVFYANNQKSKFATYKEGIIDIDYDKLNVNSEVDDAFFRSVDFVANGTDREVILYRPFAQVNIGTNDLETPAVQALISKIRTKLNVSKGLYTQMNLLDSAVVASSEIINTTFDFPTLTAPTVNEDFPVEGFSNLTSVYLLVPGTEDIINATYEVTCQGQPDITTLNLAAAPVRMNHRTNIFGTLLTSNQPFSVVLEPPFFGNMINIWDGKSITTPTQDENGNYIIRIPSDLPGLAKMVNNGMSFAGKKVILNTDIDLRNSANWAPIGTKDYPFDGEFDGADFVLKGLAKPLMNYANGANIHNLDATFTLYENSPALVKYSDGNTTLTEVTVDGTAGGRSAAGLVSTVQTGTLTIENCTNNATINASGYAGAGLVSTNAAGSNVIIKNSTNNGTINAQGNSQIYAGGLIGNPQSSVSITGSTNNGDVNVTAATAPSAAGGMIAFTSTQATVNNSTNNGNVTLNILKPVSTNMNGAGGFLGATSTFMTNTLTLTNCTNIGKITVNQTGSAPTSGIFAGGMIGSFKRGGAVMTGCTSEGEVTANAPETTTDQKQYAAGLAGGLNQLTTLTITGCTVKSSVTLTATPNPVISAYYNYFESQPYKPTLENNTNETSYGETN